MPGNNRRQDSKAFQFQQRIPKDILARARGLTLRLPIGGQVTELKVTPATEAVRASLRTTNPYEARLRHAEVSAYLEGLWTALRRPRTALSPRQATALAGMLYRAWTSPVGPSTAVLHTAQGWVAASPDEIEGEEEAMMAAALASIERLGDLEAVDLEPHFGPLVTRLLLAHGIPEVDPLNRPALLREFFKAMRDALEVRTREASGDYRPDPKAERFPAWEPPAAKPEQLPPSSLTALFESWWQEAQRTGRKRATHDNYGGVIRFFTAFLGHDDAARVTPEDVLRFKDHRLASGVSARTVKDGDLVALKTVFKWAVANRRLRANPTDGVTLAVAKPVRMRSKGFTDAEALAILRASSALDAVAKPNLPAKLRIHNARRWLPWLCAYSGARIGEVAQLRRQDLQKVEGHWTIRITPEAGTVKTNAARVVALHPHLIEMGFVRFAQAQPDGPLFLGPSEDPRSALRTVKARLVDFVREIVTDQNVMPNHGWRHRFKTVGRAAGADSLVLDAITGHAPRSEGDKYGEVPIPAQVTALARIPRIDA